MIFRLSQKLNRKVKAGELHEMPLDENPYVDWSCHLFTAQRTQYILLSNTASFYSCVMHGRGIAGTRQFIEGALSTICEFMQADGQTFVYRRFIAPSMTPVQFAKPLNRSVIGSMNELIADAIYRFESGEAVPQEVGFVLNDLLLSALARPDNHGYGRPKDAFKLLSSGEQA